MSASLFHRTGDADYPRNLKVLVVGPPKSGKTTFLSTAPNIVVGALPDAGLMSVAHLNLPFMDINSTADLQLFYNIMSDSALRAMQAKNLGMPSVDTIAIDTLDGWQEILKKEILKENRRTQMQQADWGTLKDRMREILKAFATLPLNVIFTVHSDVTTDEDGRQIYAPLLQGGIKNEVAGLVDFSLMSFRQKETLDDGTSKIAYYLKNEGDQKHPHVGNRAAGRVPEISDPDFQLLYRLTFELIDLPKTLDVEVAQAPGSVKPVQPTQSAKTEPAQSLSTPTDPPGVPAENADQPVTQTGITVLTKEYQAAHLVVPPDLSSLKLGVAREIANFFAAWKADVQAGNGTRDELIGYLRERNAFAGENQTDVETPKPAKKTQQKAAKPVTQAEQPVEEPPSSGESPADITEEAVATVQEKMPGSTVIGESVAADTACAGCSKPVGKDTEVATMALNRFKKPLCMDCYKAELKK